MHETDNLRNQGTRRIGEQGRINTSRFFHVMGEGGDLYSREGLKGPYADRRDADQTLNQLIHGKAAAKPGAAPRDPWGFNPR